MWAGSRWFVLFLWLSSAAAAEEGAPTLHGSCEYAPPIPAGYELSSIDFRNVEDVVEAYEPGGRFPQNNCMFYGGVLREGRCVQLEPGCDYRLNKAGLPEQLVVVQVIKNDCGSAPAAPWDFKEISATSALQLIAADTYRPDFGFPNNNCQAILGERAHVDKGICQREDKVCVYGYQKVIRARN